MRQGADGAGGVAGSAREPEQSGEGAAAGGGRARFALEGDDVGHQVAAAKSESSATACRARENPTLHAPAGMSRLAPCGSGATHMLADAASSAI